MTSLFPKWEVQYYPQRRSLARPRKWSGLQSVIVGQCADEERAVAAFRQQFPPQCDVVAVFPYHGPELS
jgi:hypothetical protein